MAKKIKTLIKLNLPAGTATPAPPVGPASQAFYTGTNVLLSQNRAHHAEELVEKKIPYKEKAEAKAALDSFNKSSDHGHAANDNHANGGAAANH
jgi:hypothetical protein